MKYEDYLCMYECYKTEFESYFKCNSEFYWNVFSLKFEHNYTYRSISIKMYSSETVVKEVVKKVVDFFDNIYDKLSELEYSFDRVYMPNQFINGGLTKLSANATHIFYYAVGLYQKTLFDKMMIPRTRLINLNKNYKNKPYRNEVLNELRNLNIIEKNGNSISLFRLIEDRKGSIVFSFTEDCLDYINMWRYMTRKYFSI